jgi:hypothetical protein
MVGIAAVSYWCYLCNEEELFDFVDEGIIIVEICTGRDFFVLV